MTCKPRKTVNPDERKGWAPYRPQKEVGKLCFYYCTMRSELPIRDLFGDHKQGSKVEPNYETSTYNHCASCNGYSLRAAIKDRLSHILFTTKYTGQKARYHGSYYIIGYYEIGWTNRVKGRISILAKKMCFVPIENAYKITAKRWQRINRRGKTTSLTNLRHATQRISGSLLKEIISHLDCKDATEEYRYEITRLTGAKQNITPLIKRICA